MIQPFFGSLFCNASLGIKVYGKCKRRRVKSSEGRFSDLLMVDGHLVVTCCNCHGALQSWDDWRLEIASAADFCCQTWGLSTSTARETARKTTLKPHFWVTLKLSQGVKGKCFSYRQLLVIWCSRTEVSSGESQSHCQLAAVGLHFDVRVVRFKNHQKSISSCFTPNGEKN